MHRAKQHAKDQGGEITHEYSLIKGFAYVFLLFLFPEYDKNLTLSNPPGFVV